MAIHESLESLPCSVKTAYSLLTGRPQLESYKLDRAMMTSEEALRQSKTAKRPEAIDPGTQNIQNLIFSYLTNATSLDALLSLGFRIRSCHGAVEFLL